MTHSIEIVPLHCTETGLRLRTKFKAATEYDVVARRVAKGKNEFLWRKPAETIEEALSMDGMPLLPLALA